MTLTARQAVEVFHLVFLRALSAKGEDKALIALKGGCNLRFFFGSIRYSEDIDFDAAVIAKATLANKVNRLLRSPLVAAPLRAKAIELTDISAPKQTDTTQRWKVGLRVQGISMPLRTKIEFSRRDAIAGTAFEAIGTDVLRPYGLTATLATHYARHSAIAQKIHALAGRSEPQARDVFDLSLLFAHPDATSLSLAASQAELLPQAIENAMAISFDEYRAKVVSFLDPALVSLYEERTAWEAMQDSVVLDLERLR